MGEKSMTSKVFVAGHNGMLGSALVRRLKTEPDVQILLASRDHLDIESQLEVQEFLEEHKPDVVICAAARVGGIHDNATHQYDFLIKNLRIQTNLIQASVEVGIRKLVFIGSSCIYPKHAVQPIEEESLLSGPLESTNFGYATAKICGIQTVAAVHAQFPNRFDYRSVMPCNLYGLRDSYKGKDAHVIPALIQRFHEAKCNKLRRVDVWGDENVLREFLYVDDCADAIVHLTGVSESDFARTASPETRMINVGSGREITIRDLALTISKVVDYEGEIFFDSSKPAGTPRKILDISRLLSTGWSPKIMLEEGLRLTYQDYKSQVQPGW